MSGMNGFKLPVSFPLSKETMINIFYLSGFDSSYITGNLIIDNQLIIISSYFK